VAAHGSCISQTSVEDVCFATLKYPDGTLGQIHVSWLNPRKVRTLTVVGQRKMAHWDDVEPSDTLRLYDKGVAEPPYYDSFGEFQYLLRSADVHLPKIDREEPLVLQAKAFRDCILDGAACRSGCVEAEGVVAVLEAAMESLRSGGRMTPVRRAWIEEAVSVPRAEVRGGPPAERSRAAPLARTQAESPSV
jgi:predicted dehydrogenase